MFDIDESGAIDIKELKHIMYELKMNMTDAEVKLIIEEYDIDKSGEIDF